MSHPLKRHLARVALVVAAGAAPVVGAAGAASAVELPSTNGLHPVSALDTSSLPATASQTGSEVLTTGSETANKLGESAGPTTEKALGAVQDTTGKTVEQGQGAVGDAAANLTPELPTSGLGL
ncbi:hypothetical protein OG946_25490 [Streptomyces sp. NBC_01808]|uniref:hypothetical protein n=1 Tax=Streptomyces sp. NBC_01808 TaxID=2975947 RepID=UPI002DDAEDB8|nr:hypothetical protein [Streptomyces sp. NBC_01808]WSA40427.1 hypothetical protein OG946_25490 [Streptomyces sp. NBC_01808]